jgi:hypothetical protein
MSERHQHASRCVYNLADSLDSILAACEDLLAGHSEPSHLLRIELSAITHVLQARRYIEDLDAAEPALLDQCVLFLAGTAAFDLEHLRSGRPLHPHLPASPDLRISESYMVGRQLPIGALAELTAAMLDALEAHFVLYEDENDSGSSHLPAIEERHVAERHIHAKAG